LLTQGLGINNWIFDFQLGNQVERMKPTPINLSEGLAAACKALIEIGKMFSQAESRVDVLASQLNMFKERLDNHENRVARLEEKP